MYQFHVLRDDTIAKTYDHNTRQLLDQLQTNHQEELLQRQLFEIEEDAPPNPTEGNDVSEGLMSEVGTGKIARGEDVFYDAQSMWFHFVGRYPRPHKTHRGGGATLLSCRSQPSPPAPPAVLRA
jgi:hypothetical protein